MVIVDDHIALRALAGTPPDGIETPCATTYGFHIRLLTAAFRERESGRLAQARDPLAEDLLVRPPPELLVVIDPLAVAAETARIKVESGANLLVAEVGASALVHGMVVRVAPANTGRTWGHLFDTLGVDFATIDG